MSQPFVGEIRPFGFNFAPRGWAFCNGAILSISQNTALFSLLGTYYGGNGTSTFALPNLQGIVPMHQGQGRGLSTYVIGETGGTPNVTLLQAQLPSHSHGLNAFAGRGPAAGDSPTSTVLTTSGADEVYDTTVPQSPATLNPTTIAAAGGGQPHNNLMPYLAINFCIALQGIYPARS